MEFGLLMGAALLSLVGALFHGVAGHRLYMGNINASNLEPLAKTLSLVSWHTFTIILLVGAGTLACVAYNPTMNLMAYPIILTNAAGALMFLALGLGSHRQLLTLPGLYLMGGTAMLAALGIS
ncbi:MAG: hypothetical protein P8O92_08840 [Luminiphilus sp.]|nr:hypothetical protein [Luminiphilus sp.]